MFMTFWSTLPWQLWATVYLFLGLAVAVSMLMIPKRKLAEWSILSYRSPNALTWWSLLLHYIGFVHFFCGLPLIGFLIIVVASMLDLIDGKMAKAMEEFGVFRAPEDVAIGKRLDPFVDKARVLPSLLILAWMGVADFRIVIPIIVMDVIGTVTREPFSLGARWMRGESATWIGKIKALLQNFGLILCGPIAIHWYEDRTQMNGLFIAALVFGILSVLSRVSWSRSVDRAIDEGTQLFKHEDL